MGLGAEAASVAGKDRNEDWAFADGETRPNTVAHEGDPVPVGNDHGGTQGGITTGEPICGEATWHAPTSIPAEQTTVDWETGEKNKSTSLAGTTRRSRRELFRSSKRCCTARFSISLSWTAESIPTDSTIPLVSTTPTTIRRARKTRNEYRYVG